MHCLPQDIGGPPVREKGYCAGRRWLQWTAWVWLGGGAPPAAERVPGNFVEVAWQAGVHFLHQAPHTAKNASALRFGLHFKELPQIVRIRLGTY